MKAGEVRVEGVSKRFRRYASLRERLRRTEHGRRVVWGLDDVSMRVAPGEMVGLVGTNGSGKSTLLRLIGGVTVPTRGTVRAGGTVAGILTLGDGFHPEFTGRENARTGAMLAGMSRAEAERGLDEMLDFADLGAAVNDPMRTYSSGMIVRLAYSVASHVAADVLLVDEALAVGDLAFSTKCLAHMAELHDTGTTILLASHDLGVMRERCDRVAWLAGGRLRRFGPPDDVIDEYELATHTETQRVTPQSRREAGRLGSGDVEIGALSLTAGSLTAGRKAADVIRSGGSLNLEFDVTAHVPVESFLLGVSVHDPITGAVVDLHREVDANFLSDDGRGTCALTLHRLDLRAGTYTVAVGVYENDFAHAYDYWWEAARFEVSGAASSAPVVPPHEWATLPPGRITGEG